MPIYCYKNLKTGKTEERFSTIAARDSERRYLRRILAVSGRGPVTGKRLDPQSADAAVPRAFRQLEDQHRREKIEKGCGFSVQELKNIWNFK